MEQARRSGHSRLVYDKAKRTIATIDDGVSASPKKLVDALVEEALSFFQPEDDSGAAFEHMRMVLRQRFALILGKRR